MRPIDRVTIRRAGPGDAVRLLELSALDDGDQLIGEVLVADVDGELWAAVEVSSDRALADPFRPSASMVELLRLRAQRLRHADRRRPSSYIGAQYFNTMCLWRRFRPRRRPSWSPARSPNG